MNCTYCGFFNDEETDHCGRCGADLPEPSCEQCSVEVEWGTALCEQCRQVSESADKTPCPSCGALNNVSAEYCTSCGTPMAVITKVTQLARATDRAPLETWRVYGIETQVVGRKAEMETLARWLDRVFDQQHAHLVTVTGDTGLGKSRLLAEFQQRVDERFSETVVMESTCRNDSGGAYALFTRLLKNRFYISENEHPQTARRKFTEAVRTIVESDRAERIAHLVGHAIGIPFPDSPHVDDSREETEELNLDRPSVQALVELLEADAAANPLVINLEDLQYATRQSLRLIRKLRDHLADAPILFVLTWNPAELFFDTVLEEMQADAVIELNALSDREVRDFVRQTLHRADDIPEGMVDEIVDAAHGNPLSVEEILRILISDGIIDTRSETWKIHEDRFEDIALPTTVEATVRARLEALGATERQVLEMAACVGDSFWPGVLQALFHLLTDQQRDAPTFWGDEGIDEQLHDTLESLERKDMVRRRDDSSLKGREELYFKHRLERQTLLDDLSSQDRQRYHRLIAQWLDREVEQPGLRVAEQVARHFDRAHCLEHAARKYIAAADLADAHFANQKAIELYTKGLGYLSDADVDLKLHAFHDLGSVYSRRGEYDQALAYFREMLRYSWLVNDPAKGGAATNKIGRALRGLGDYDDALEQFERALDLFWRVSDLRGVASTLDDIGKIHWIRGNYDEALSYYSAGLQLRREAADDRAVALSLSNLGSLKLQRGQLKDAMVYYKEALQLRLSIDDKQGVADSYNTVGVLCMERDDPDSAIPLFEEALELARDIGLRVLAGIALNNLGEAYLKLDRPDEALEYLEEARRVADAAGDKRVRMDVSRNLGRVAMARREHDLAFERIRECLELAETLDSEVLLGIGKESLADVYASKAQATDDEQVRQDADREARDLYREAITLLDTTGNEAKLGRCLTNFGEFLVDRGEPIQGKKNLEQAREIFERLELKKLREATEQRMARYAESGIR